MTCQKKKLDTQGLKTDVCEKLFCMPNNVIIITILICVVAPEGKRSSGLTSVWVARNRFAVLDRTHSVCTAGFHIYFVGTKGDYQVCWNEKSVAEDK